MKSPIDDRTTVPQSTTTPDNITTKKRRTVSTHACSFCQKRHMKCDGDESNACTQCKSRSIECSFGVAQKRGRKVNGAIVSTDVVQRPHDQQSAQGHFMEELLAEIKNVRQDAEFWRTKFHEVTKQPLLVNFLQNNQVSPPLQSATDCLFHFPFIGNFVQMVAPLFPMFVPECFSVAMFPTFSFKMSDSFSWEQWQNFVPDHNVQYNLEDIYRALEYSVICLHGSRISQSNLTTYFVDKAETFMQMMAFKGLDLPTELAGKLILIMIIYSFFYTSEGRDDKTRFVIQLANAVFSAHKSVVPLSVQNRLYGHLAATARDQVDKLHWVNKVQASSEELHTITSTLCVVSYVSLTIRPSSFDTQIYTRLLELANKLDAYNLKSYYNWIEDDAILRVEQAFLSHQLQLLPEDAIEKMTVDAATTLLSRTRIHLGLASGIILALKILHGMKSNRTLSLQLECDKALENMQKYFSVVKHMREAAQRRKEAASAVTLVSPLIPLPPEISDLRNEINLDFGTPTESTSSPSDILPSPPETWVPSADELDSSLLLELS